MIVLNTGSLECAGFLNDSVLTSINNTQLWIIFIFCINNFTRIAVFSVVEISGKKNLYLDGSSA
jgi:hypothetical protein